MSKERKILEEALALRYMDLAGIGSINEEIDVEELSEPVEGVAAGGENLVHPIDHVDVVADESNVQGVEVADARTGEVEPVKLTVEGLNALIREVLQEERQASSDANGE